MVENKLAEISKILEEKSPKKVYVLRTHIKKEGNDYSCKSQIDFLQSYDTLVQKNLKFLQAWEDFKRIGMNRLLNELTTLQKLAKTSNILENRKESVEMNEEDSESEDEHNEVAEEDNENDELEVDNKNEDKESFLTVYNVLQKFIQRSSDLKYKSRAKSYKLHDMFDQKAVQMKISKRKMFDKPDELIRKFVLENPSIPTAQEEVSAEEPEENLDEEVADKSDEETEESDEELEESGEDLDESYEYIEEKEGELEEFYGELEELDGNLEEPERKNPDGKLEKTLDEPEKDSTDDESQEELQPTTSVGVITRAITRGVALKMRQASEQFEQPSDIVMNLEEKVNECVTRIALSNKYNVEERKYKKIEKSPNKRPELPTDDGKSPEIIIGPNGTSVSRKAWNTINWTLSGPAITRKILMEVFDRSILAFHTLTGKPSPAFADFVMPKKTQLNPDKVVDITDFMTTYFDMTAREVRSAITTKCADENKMHRQREQKQHQKKKRTQRKPK